MSVLFSIIVPTFNRAQDLDRLLDCLLNQTYKNFEVIICDDGSNDNSKEIVVKYSNKMLIKYFWSENWGGPAKPRNLGIKESVGEWLCFLDSDDWWYSNKLENCLKFINDFDFIYHKLHVFDSKGEFLTKRKIGFSFKNDMFQHLLIYGNCIPNSSVVVRKSILNYSGNFSENRNDISMEDFDLWIRISLFTKRFKFIDISLGVYNWESDTNISKISKDRIIKEHSLFERYLNNLNSKNKQIALCYYNYKIGRYYLHLKEFNLGEGHLVKAIKGPSIIIKIKSILYLFYYKIF
jgi:glycosyltransferase involved in cell wall biosynthesis